MPALSIVPDTEVYWSNISPEPNSGCWLWTGRVSTAGYGVLAAGVAGARNNEFAHRFAWRMHFGEIPEGMFILHRCDVRCCVNPDHLRIGDHQSNRSDMAKRWRGTRSASGNLFGVAFHSGSGMRKRFSARVKYLGKSYSLGYYFTAEEASAVAVAFKEKLYREGEQK
jgi:hypothetical protein